MQGRRARLVMPKQMVTTHDAAGPNKAYDSCWDGCVFLRSRQDHVMETQRLIRHRMMCSAAVLHLTHSVTLRQMMSSHV